MVFARYLGMSYAELLCLSNFSFQRGAAHPFELVKRAKELGYAALALCDECTLAGIVRAHEAAKSVQLKLIIGSQFRFADSSRIALLAPTALAYSQLCALITRARRAASKGEYQINEQDFEAAIEHCISLFVPGVTLEEKKLHWFAALPCTHKYLAVTHHLAQQDDAKLESLLALSKQLHLPCIATGDVHYHVRDRRRLHDVMTAIRLKTTVAKIGKQGFANGERHLRPFSTLHKLFPAELLDASVRIADQCQFSLDELRYDYPHELVPEGSSPSAHLRALTERGAAKRWPSGTPAAIQKQIDKELTLIAELKYEHYFLTVEDIVRHARSLEILCQGRGSAANSVVCYALQITEVDPARVGMLFERFISKERAEPPDIDIDFEHQRREEVIQYIYGKYGRERTALAATVICYRPRMAIRDVGRALGLPVNIVSALSKRFQWFDDQAHLGKELLRLGIHAEALVAQQLRSLVQELIGFPRHLSQHVGGFVISERPLHTLVPVENAAMPDRTLIQWDKEDLESLGLLKVDCLALGMLSALRRTLETVSKYKQQPFTMQNIPAEDPATYESLCRADAIGVFQVESRAQLSMLPRLKPRSYYDLVIEVAIIRPGPIQGGMLQAYLKRRQGLESISYPSKTLEKVLSRTCGVPIFQEQVMQIAMVAAGFSAGEADQVRRSMAAWQRRGDLGHFRERLLQGMQKNGYTSTFAEQIYQQIRGFGSYGFPESHAASFALLAYISAWLHHHEPAAFCAGLLNSQPMGFYAPAQLLADARRHGVNVLPADVQCSDWDCTLETLTHTTAPALRLGLRLISGLSAAQAQAIATARTTHPFRDVNELAHRTQLPKRALDVLARAGALASLTPTRHAARWQAKGIEHLPGLLAGASAVEPIINLPRSSESSEVLQDYRSLGFTLGRHPLALLRTRFNKLKVSTAQQLADVKNGALVRIAGLVTHRQRPETAKGIIFVSLEDETGISNLIVNPEAQACDREALLDSVLMLAQGRIRNQQGVIHIHVDHIRNYSRWLGSLTVSSRDFH
jgi:error-prone DNA polymerase